MKVLVLDQGGSALTLALRIRDAGHTVLWGASDAPYGRDVPGVECVDNWANHASTSDLILSAFRSSRLDFFKARGHRVLSPLDVTSMLNSLPNSPAQLTFKTPREARKWLKDEPERYSVLTFSGEYTSLHAADAAAYLNTLPESEPVVLRRHVEGVTLHVSQYIGSSQQHIRVGCVGIFSAPDVRFVIPECKDASWLSITYVIDKSGVPWPRQVTSKLIDPLWLAAWPGDMTLDPSKVIFDVKVHVRLKFRRCRIASCLPLWGVTRGTALHLHPRMVSHSGQTWMSAGHHIADIVGRGLSVGQAIKRAKSTADKLHCGDAKCSMPECVGLDELHRHGYAESLVYG